MPELLHELRTSVRTLAKRPGFALLAMMTIALGIGATTAMFTVVDGVLLKPLRYRHADQIVAINTESTDRGRTSPRVTGGDFIDLRAQSSTFAALATYYGGQMGVQLPGRAEFAGTMFTNTEFMDVFEVTPSAGRSFTAEDAERAAIVSAGFAQRNLGGVEAAPGKTLRVEDRAYTVVGVAPPTFSFPERTEVWLAASRDPQNVNRTAYNYRAVGRLRDGMSLEQANARLSGLSSQLAQAYPDSNKNKLLRVRSLRDQLVTPVSTTLWVLMGAVGLVLLIACANVANLMLARSTERSREMAVRAALGASRLTIVRQTLTESMVIAFVGGMLGIGIAWLATQVVVLRMTDAVALPRLADVSLDGRVLLFTVLACTVANIGFGLVPAIQASRVNVADALKHAGTRGTAGGQSAKLRSALVVSQIALSCMLVVAAGLLFRSFLSLMNTDLGFRSDGVLVMYAHAPARSDEDFARVLREQEQLYTRIGQLPGVVSVAGAMGLPAGDYGSNGGYIVEGQGTIEHAPTKLPQAIFSLSSPGYFSTMGIPLVHGRDFTAADQAKSEPVVVISQALAKQSFGNEDPLGRRIQCGLDEATMRWMTVVGVVGDVRQDSPASGAGPAMYMPLAQHGSRANEVQVAVRTQVPPESLIDPVQRLVRAADPEIAMRFTTMQAMVSESVAAPRLRTTLALAFALLALTLAGMGVYAVMNYTTVQRTGEFAIRAALGATPRAILELVLFGAGRLAILGVAIGVALALALSRVLSSLLFGLKSTDAGTYLSVVTVVLLAVLSAAFAPALRAARVDPMQALREQ